MSLATLLLPLLLSSPSHAETQLDLGNLTVDGVELQTLRCTLQSGALMAPLTISAALSGIHATLDACAPQGAAFRLAWTWPAGGTPGLAVAASTLSAADACVIQAVKPPVSGIVGSCVGVLLAGNLEKARAAVATLPATAP